jgi:hypothetical protein
MVEHAIVVMRTANTRRDRRRQDQVEIGARIERARHRFHRLRHHQRPGENGATGDDDQRAAVGVDLDLRELRHHRIGDEVHEQRKRHDGDRNDADALRLARGEHREPVAPGEAGLMLREEGEGGGCHVSLRPRNSSCPALCRASTPFFGAKTWMAGA